MHDKPDWFKQILKNWEKLDAEYKKSSACKKSLERDKVVKKYGLENACGINNEGPSQ